MPHSPTILNAHDVPFFSLSFFLSLSLYAHHKCIDYSGHELVSQYASIRSIWISYFDFHFYCTFYVFFFFLFLFIQFRFICQAGSLSRLAFSSLFLFLFGTIHLSISVFPHSSAFHSILHLSERSNRAIIMQYNSVLYIQLFFYRNFSRLQLFLSLSLSLFFFLHGFQCRWLLVSPLCADMCIIVWEK